MLVRIRTCIFILICIITAVTYVAVWKGDGIMAMTVSTKEMTTVIPAMDKTVPVHTETATFALG